MTSGFTADFLDINTTIDKISGELIFKPFFKKTNNFSYIISFSNHPNFILKNIQNLFLLASEEFALILMISVSFLKKLSSCQGIRH